MEWYNLGLIGRRAGRSIGEAVCKPHQLVMPQQERDPACANE
jgi:hypothetical protein